MQTREVSPVTKSSVGLLAVRKPRGAVRRLMVLGAAAVLLAGLSACTADVTAAAIVGETQIPVTQVDSRTDAVVAQAGQSFDSDTLIDLGRQELSTQIRHQILSDLGLLQPQDEETLQALATQLGGLESVAQQVGAATIDELMVRLGDLSAQLNLIAAASQAGTAVPVPLVTFDYVSAQDYTDAIRLRALYEKDPASLSIDAQAAGAEGGGVGQALNPVANGSFAVSGVFGAQIGQIIVVALGGTQVVLRVTDRQVVNEPLDPQSVLSSGAGAAGIQAVAGLLLSGMAADLPVQVNPRYGVWDTTTMQVTNEPGRR